MTFDKWFKEQTLVVRIVLLIIPFVNWIVEILVRASALMRKGSNINLLGLVLFIFFGWILGFVDLILVIIGSDLLFLE